MASLEDKILGERLENYCSSSEDERDSDYEDAGSDTERPSKQECDPAELPPPNAWNGSASNTGPKGVIEDWRKFKQLESENRDELKKERIALAKKLTLTCRTEREEQKAKHDAEMEDELEELLDDEFLMQYQKQRMRELMEKLEKVPRFGKVITLNDSTELLNAIDNEDPSVCVVVHIYDEKVRACETMDGCLPILAGDYPSLKFCRIAGNLAGLSTYFVEGGVPALLVYKAGHLIGNFVRISSELGNDFYAVDVERFLIEYGFLPEKV